MSQPAVPVTEAPRQGNRPAERDSGRSGEGRPEGNSERGQRSGGHSGGTVGGQRSRGGENSINYAIWDNVVDQLKAANPVYRTITIQDGSASVATNMYGNMRASDRYTFHPYRGHITDSELYKDSSKATKMRGWIYSVHVGSFGGMTTKIIFFIVCLTGAFLPLTGYYIFCKKRFKKKKAVQI